MTFVLRMLSLSPDCVGSSKMIIGEVYNRLKADQSYLNGLYYILKYSLTDEDGEVSVVEREVHGLRTILDTLQKTVTTKKQIKVVGGRVKPLSLQLVTEDGYLLSTKDLESLGAIACSNDTVVVHLSVSFMD